MLPPFLLITGESADKIFSSLCGKGRKPRNAVFLKILKEKFFSRCLFVKYGSRQRGKARTAEENRHIDGKNAQNKKKYVQNPSFSTFT